MTYEEANWAKLSPKFREAHNRLRCARGMVPIPAPKKDLYVAPRGPAVKPYSFDDPEFIAEARRFMSGGGGSMIPGSSGFTINKIPRNDL